MDDEIRQFFANLTPGDFDRTTSALHEAVYPSEVAGKELFTSFVLQMLDTTRIAFAASGGMMQPFALLHGRKNRRLFIPDMDETMEMWINRLRREAEEIDAIWFYLAMVGPGGQNMKPYKEEDAERIEADIAEGVLTDVLLWYGEAADPDEKVVFGLFTIENEQLSDPIIDEEDGIPEDRGASYLFRRVMAPIRQLAGRNRLQVNPEPLKVVEERGQVPTGTTESRTRRDHLRTWLATGGTEAEFNEHYPPEQ